MGSTGLHQWESDPLFSAAEVVQDSADRMESLFRLLLHDQSLVQGDHPDPRLLTSIGYHKRDLATILETAKWQLEDFERAVNSSAMLDKSRTRENVISRHRQFISAIREQINHVEKSVVGTSMGSSVRNGEWVNLNEQDRNGLALFLIGGNTAEQSKHYENEDGSILRRFLDPTSGSSLTDNEIIEHGSTDIEKLNLSIDVPADPCSSRDGGFRKSGDNCHWDLEADGVTSKNVFHENKSRGFYSRMSFGFLNNLRTMYGSKVTKNYIKRVKDGDEQRRSPRYSDAPFSVQGQYTGLGLRSGSFSKLCSRLRANLAMLGSSLEAQYQRFPCQIQVNRHTMQLIFTIIFALIFFGVLLSRIA